MTQLLTRLWTVADYHRMEQAGIFNAGERVELLAGQVVPMAAKGTPHTVSLTRTNELMSRLREYVQMIVRIQDPITLDDYSEPEPDVVLVRPDPLYYIERHPIPADVYLVIEIADSSLALDCGIKANLYAQAGIGDYWVLEVNQRQLRVFREPSDVGYLSQRVLPETATLAPLQFPNLPIAIQDLLPLLG